MPRTVAPPTGALTGLLLAFALAAEALAGGAAYPLGDLQPGDENTSFGGTGSFLAFGGDVVFGGRGPQHGYELRRFDGSEVTVLEDVRPGPVSGLESHPVELNGRLYFQGDDGALGAELWVSDGTAAGAVPVADVCPGACHGLLGPPTVALGLLWFTGDDGALGAEPWVSDGTAAGTRPVADLCPGPCHSLPGWAFWEWEQRVYFVANDGETGWELWVSDGTVAGTEQVADLCPGFCTSAPDHLTPWAGHLYFSAADSTGGEQVWRTDGGGTVEPVTDVEGGVSARGLVPFADRLYVLGSTVWRTDGTVAGTRPATELLVHGLNTWVREIEVAGARLFFSVDSGPEGELWALDAQAVGAHRVATGFTAAPSPLSRFGDRVAFRARTPSTGSEPWISDGTPGGTFLLVDARPGPSGSTPRFFTETGGQLWFGAGWDPWVSDGTPTGTHRVAELNRPRANGFLSPIASLGDQAVFFSSSPGADTLWGTDGTVAGTQPMLVFGTVLGGRGFRAVGDRLLFTGSPLAGGGFGLHITDGTADGTERLAGENTQVTPALGAVYFSPMPNGQRLWTSDGTPEGTHEVLDVNPGYTTFCPGLCPPIPDYPRQLTEADGLLYFVAFEPDSPLQLWVSDGTAGGSQPVHTFPSGDPGPAGMTAHAAGGVLFAASIEDAGNELWWSDGTEEGTVPVADLLEGPLSSNPRGFVRFGQTTLFVASDRSGGDHLWRADGSPPVPSRVRTFASRPARARAGSLSVAGTQVYFPLFHPSHGQELWVSDGTRKGTRLLVDLRPGPGGSYPQPLAFAAGRLFFAADDGETGLELWATDGTTEGTALVQDLAPGPPPSNPNNAAMAGDLLVFFANDGIHGNEPWALDPATVGSPVGVPVVRVQTLAP